MIKRILVIFLVITGIYIIFSNFPVLSLLGFNSTNNQSAEITERIDSIEIQTTSVPTTIIPENREDLSVDYDGKGTVKIDHKSDTVKVEVTGPTFSFFSINRNADLKIFIPEDYNRNMEIKVGSGTLELSGPSKENPMKLDELEITLGSGKLELRNLIVNHIDHKGSSGKVDVDNIQSTASSFDMSSGKLNIHNYSGAIDAEVSSGEMNIQIDELNGHSSVKASSGRINLDLPDDADFTLMGRTSSGTINSEFDLTDENISKNRLEGKYGTGKYKLDLQVSSGNIRLY
ncbi:MAG: LiaG family protein [Bacillota bacterium]